MKKFYTVFTPFGPVRVFTKENNLEVIAQKGLGKAERKDGVLGKSINGNQKNLNHVTVCIVTVQDSQGKSSVFELNGNKSIELA